MFSAKAQFKLINLTTFTFIMIHEQPLHAIEGIEWPFMVIFFVLAGANLELRMLSSIGLICAVYIIFRIAGKMVGARIGGQFARRLMMRQRLTAADFGRQNVSSWDENTSEGWLIFNELKVFFFRLGRNLI